MYSSYTAMQISKYIVNKCITDKNEITNVQLQKILFCIQKQYLGIYMELFPDDFEAWAFGPCIPEVYYYFGSAYGGMPITMPSGNVLPDDRTRAIIDPIIEAKRNLLPWEWAGIVQKKGGSWEYTWSNGAGSGRKIPKELIAKE